MPYRSLRWESKSILSGWWFVGLVFGVTSALTYKQFMGIWRTTGLALLAAVLVTAPFAGVCATRAVTRLLRKRKPKRRGAVYADYAYIL